MCLQTEMILFLEEKTVFLKGDKKGGWFFFASLPAPVFKRWIVHFDHWINLYSQRAKKVVSDRPWLVDFCYRASEF